MVKRYAEWVWGVVIFCLVAVAAVYSSSGGEETRTPPSMRSMSIDGIRLGMTRQEADAEAARHPTYCHFFTSRSPDGAFCFHTTDLDDSSIAEVQGGTLEYRGHIVAYGRWSFPGIVRRLDDVLGQTGQPVTDEAFVKGQEPVNAPKPREPYYTAISWKLKDPEGELFVVRRTDYTTPENSFWLIAGHEKTSCVLLGGLGHCWCACYP